MMHSPPFWAEQGGAARLGHNRALTTGSWKGKCLQEEGKERRGKPKGKTMQLWQQIFLWKQKVYDILRSVTEEKTGKIDCGATENRHQSAKPSAVQEQKQHWHNIRKKGKDEPYCETLQKITQMNDMQRFPTPVQFVMRQMDIRAITLTKQND